MCPDNLERVWESTISSPKFVNTAYEAYLDHAYAKNLAKPPFMRICREFENWRDFCALSGKFLRQKFCYPESFRFFWPCWRWMSITIHSGMKSGTISKTVFEVKMKTWLWLDCCEPSKEVWREEACCLCVLLLSSITFTFYHRKTVLGNFLSKHVGCLIYSELTIFQRRKSFLVEKLDSFIPFTLKDCSWLWRLCESTRVLLTTDMQNWFSDSQTSSDLVKHWQR